VSRANTPILFHCVYGHLCLLESRTEQ
jgi:hypothetical protein